MDWWCVPTTSLALLSPFSILIAQDIFENRSLIMYSPLKTLHCFSFALAAYKIVTRSLLPSQPQPL